MARPVTARAVVLEVDGVGKSFGNRTVLKAASFHATQRAVTALMGRNGVGKSTLLRIAVGRVRPDFGRVAYRGEFLPRPSLARMARAGLLYCAQSGALSSLYRIREHLAAMADTFGGRERLEEAIGTMALEEFLNRRPTQVSMGERQRAVMALALVRRPDCLLMDEPFAGVEPRDRPLVGQGIRTLREAGSAVVITGHDVEDVFQVSDQVIWVTAGTTHWLGPPEAARENHQFRREYLGPGRPGSRAARGREARDGK
jgi:lipopolysaccharide export system ATP-binding protein